MAENTIEIDLGRAVRLDELPALGAAFLRWWASELLELVPQRLRKLLPQRKAEAFVFVAGDTWRVRHEQEVDEIAAEVDGTTLRAKLLCLMPDYEQRRFTALIPNNQALIRRIQLPMIADARVRPAVELQVDRLTPFKAENVRFACRVVERRIEENDMSVDIAVAPRALLDEIEAKLATAGIKPAAIDIADTTGNGLGFNLRDEGRALLSRRYRLINTGLALSSAFAWLMAYYAFGAADEAEIARWQARIAEIRPQAQHSADLARQVAALSQPLDIAASRNQLTPLDVLKELTAAIPDSAHLFELRLNGNNLEATGLAKDAPGLIAKLDGSKMFGDARFRSAVTRRPGAAQDRFELALKIKGAKR